MTEIQWSNPVSGFFSARNDWSTGRVPGASDDAILDAAGAPYTVTSNNSRTVNGIDLDANATLAITGGTFTATNGTDGGVNAGVIALNSTSGVNLVVGGALDDAGAIILGGSTGGAVLNRMEIEATGVTLTGGGTVTLGSGQRGYITGASDGDAQLTNVDNTITGSGAIRSTGSFSSYGITLVNEAMGVVDAAGTDDDLSLDYMRVTNSGLLEATGGGRLSFFAANVDNTGGEIFAGAESTVTFYSEGPRSNTARPDGGTFGTAAGGEINLYAGASTSGGAITNAGTIFARGGIPLVLDADTTLTGGGTLRLYGNQSQSLSAAKAGVVLSNVDNTITGAGLVGAGGLDLINAASGVIDADGLGNRPLFIEPATFSNAGLVEASGTSKAKADISGAVDNTGTLEANGGVLIVFGAVTGTGVAAISAGTLDFASSFSENVSFTGKHGKLELADSTAYAGEVTGFSKHGGTSLDLRDIAFTGSGEATYSGTAISGVLTVTDGTHTAAIHLAGDYLGATFTASSDHNGGTHIVATTPARGAAAGHAFIATMAGMGALGGEAAHAIDVGLARMPLLAGPRTMTA